MKKCFASVFILCAAACGTSDDHLSRADRALEIGDLQLAVQLAEEELEKNPESAGARRMLVDAHERSGEWPEAVAHARVLANLEPTPANRFRLAFALAMVGDNAAAERQLSEWPAGVVRRMLYDSLAAARLLQPRQSPAWADEIRDAFQADSTRFRQVAQRLGTSRYFGTLVVLSATTARESEDIATAETLAGRYKDLKQTSAEIAEMLQPSMLEVLRSLRAPPEPTRETTATLTSFFMNTERYHVVAGQLEEALGRNTAAIRHYDEAQSANDFLTHILNMSGQISSATLRKLTLYRSIGDWELLAAVCADLIAKKPEAYAANPPSDCIGTE